MTRRHTITTSILKPTRAIALLGAVLLIAACDDSDGPSSEPVPSTPEPSTQIYDVTVTNLT